MLLPEQQQLHARRFDPGLWEVIRVWIPPVTAQVMITDWVIDIVLIRSPQCLGMSVD
jgi:hypothetical protein